MSKIIYKPHCDKCGFPIDTSEGEVMYQDVYEGNTESATLTRKKGHGYKVVPYVRGEDGGKGKE